MIGSSYRSDKSSGEIDAECFNSWVNHSLILSVHKVTFLAHIASNDVEGGQCSNARERTHSIMSARIQQRCVESLVHCDNMYAGVLIMEFWNGLPGLLVSDTA